MEKEHIIKLLISYKNGNEDIFNARLDIETLYSIITACDKCLIENREGNFSFYTDDYAYVIVRISDIQRITFDVSNEIKDELNKLNK